MINEHAIILERWKIYNIGKQTKQPPSKNTDILESEFENTSDESPEKETIVEIPLVNCEKCNSQFEPDNFVVHERNCYYIRNNVKVVRKQFIIKCFN